MQTLRTISIVAALLLLPTAVFAVDGVVLIDQNKAMAGNVTPGDTPGFPVTISQPGSYRLDSNLTLPDIFTTAILVHADNVTIDLNGFSIIGPSTCPVGNCAFSVSGIDASSTVNNFTVKNGMIRGIQGAGINVLGSAAHIEKVLVSNSKFGIIASGTISDCIVQQNYDGIVFGEDGNLASITNVVAYGNSNIGIEGFAGRVSNSVFLSNSFGLYLVGGYFGNLFNANSQDIAGSSLNMGQNVCNGALCP